MYSRKKFEIFLIVIGLILTLGLSNEHVAAGQTQPSNTDFAAIDAYVNEQVANLDIPGLALGIVQDGRIAHLEGFGVTDSSGRSIGPQTPFFIGSVTKSFTALAVMQLVEAGKINLDVPIQEYLPWFELADKEASATITVRNLLNQSSGISTKNGNGFWSSQQGLEETVRGLYTIQLTQPVGKIYQYSNLNFMIAGLIVEQVSGQSYGDYVTHHIFEPLEMRHSYTSRAAALADGLAQEHYYMLGHVFGNKGPQPPANLPAGGLISSAEDLLHYMIAQMNGGRYGERSVLSPQGVAEMHTPAVPRDGDDNYYAMGWNAGTIDGIPTVWHSGDDGRSHAIVIMMPVNEAGLVLLANSSGFEQRTQIDEIALGILDLFNGEAAASVSLPFLLRFLYWVSLLTPLLMLLGIVLVWRNRRRGGIWLLILTVVANLAVVFLLFRLSLIEITLPSMLVFYPELGYSLIAVATLGIGWSVVYMAMYLQRRKLDQ